jgi:hypothetical protein
VAAPLFAANPVLTALQPRGAQQGKTFTLMLAGTDLEEGSKILTTLPATLTPLTRTEKGLPFLVELKAEAAVGVYPVRVEGTNGLSNILLFTVGAFPETDESELHDRQVPATPVTIDGTLKGAVRGDYHIRARLGERLVFEVEARRCGSAIDPALELYDEKSNLIARSEDAPGLGVDARIDYTFARAGAYTVVVHDARFSKQDQNFYRLKIGAYSYPEAVFPLGGRHGQTVDFSFSGRGGSAHASVTLPDHGDYATVAMPGSPALPFRLALGDDPELAEPVQGALPVPVVVNGIISKPAEIDRYTLDVKPGESYLIEARSRELETSRLDALITVRDAQGAKLASAGDIPPAQDVLSAQAVGRTSNDPYLNFKVPPDINKVSIDIEDIAQRGGPDFAYRLRVRRTAEEFLMSATPAYLNVPRGGTAQISVTADRRGYDGPIQATIPLLPKGWSAAGGFIAAETPGAASRRGVMSLSVAADADLPASDLRIVGEARLADGTVLRREAAGLGTTIDVAGGTGLPDPASNDRQKSFTAPWLGLAMPVAEGPEPAATLELRALGRTPMGEGDAYDFEWKVVTKNPDLAMPARVSVDTPGVRDTRVIDMKQVSKGSATGTFRVTTTKATAPARYDIAVSANLMVNGVRETIYSRAVPFEVSEVNSGESTAKTVSGGN